MTQVEELQAEIDNLKVQLRKSNRTVTDTGYMMHALHPMLGPKGRQAYQMWLDKNIVRIHFDWATDPMNMDGEDVAQLYLDWAEAEKNAQPLTREELEKL